MTTGSVDINAAFVRLLTEVQIDLLTSVNLVLTSNHRLGAIMAAGGFPKRTSRPA